MRIPEFWLRSWIDTSASVEEIADALTMAGLEVEDLEAAAPPFSGVVLARIEAAEKHPDADRLRVCRVNAGPGAESLQIICGAPNARAGIFVACAREGALLPGNFKIKRAKMRGVESQGMLCSLKELGISEESEGIVELSPEPGMALGMNLREMLGLDEKTLTLKLTPNRPDCLSVLGVARELSAVLAVPLRTPSALAEGVLSGLAPFIPHPEKLARESSPVCPVASNRQFPIRLHPDAVSGKQPLCGRFSSRVIEGVDASVTTPAFIKRRLEAVGQRSISVLVDISNYVMLELGRPTHIFDLDALRPLPEGGIEVRWARPGESFALLNGQSPVLNEYFGVIADAQGPVALAGIMGGERTAVSPQTKNILIEAAFWWPDAVRGRSQQLKFSTDAGHRFERGVSAATTVAHIEIITALILQICGGRAGPLQDDVRSMPARPGVTMRRSRCEKVMGRPYSAAEISAVFTRLQLAYRHESRDSDDVFHVTPPAERFDLEIEEDLIEEVARIVGFAKIDVRSPTAVLTPKIPAETQRSAHSLRQALVYQDFHEVVTYSFIEPALADLFARPEQQVRLLNPIAAQYSVMRPSLLPSLVRVLQDNLARQESRVRIFEVGRVFSADSSVRDDALSVAGIDQPVRLSALAYGPAHDEQWGVQTRPIDFYDLKSDLDALVAPLSLHYKAIGADASLGFLHPGMAAQVSLDGKNLGWIGVVHPSLQQAWQIPQPVVAFEIDLQSLLHCPMPTPQAPSKFPMVIRDLAFVVGTDVTAGSITSAILQLKQKSDQLLSLKNFKCFDEYRGQGIAVNEKSLAFRFYFQDTLRTLEDADIEQAVAAIVRAVQEDCKATLRVA
ncbi:MAG: phenylalanine--tRNA ligase subunit beta [Burkholderiaceae bacterium]